MPAWTLVTTVPRARGDPVPGQPGLPGAVAQLAVDVATRGVQLAGEGAGDGELAAAVHVGGALGQPGPDRLVSPGRMP